jgi:tetratricopeptide (TPR) repeat protein
MWSDQFDRELKDVFTIQEEIARGIVNRLRLKLGRGQRRYDIDVTSSETYFRARELQATRFADARRAIPLFESVVRTNPTFAPAHAALASTTAALSSTYPVFAGFALRPEDAHAAARPAALKAIELDPLLAEAHAAMGYVHALERDWKNAEASFRHALSLNPAITTIHTDFVLSTLWPEGKLNEALLLLEAALRTDPLSLDVRRVMANIQISSGQYDQAIDNARRVLARNPMFPFAVELWGRAEVQKGDVAAGIARLEEHRDRNEGWLGYAYAISGRRAEAEDLLQRNAKLPQRQALIYAGLGDKDGAFEALERLAILNAGRAGAYLTFPEMALLRGDPRVAALRKKLGLP